MMYWHAIPLKVINTLATFNTHYYDKLPMASMPEKRYFDGNEIKANLTTKIIGKAIQSYDIVDSTNTNAMKLASEGAEEGTVVLAKMQRMGKGRLNREWHSPKGGLWLSLILRPDINSSEATRLTLMAALAVARTIRGVYNLDAKIKWPNDVLIKGKKVCGIFTEARSLENRIDYVILGIGINANFDLKDLPEEIRNLTTTLGGEIGSELDLEKLLLALLMEIDKYYEILKIGNTNIILNEWRKLSDTLGRRVKIITLKETIEGIALDVDDMGALIVRTDDNKEQKFLAGDCVHVSKTI
jgi:BirA family biotin operon repressor/biotin-[acetyl-CoA-carboxylase] ligase